MRTLALAALLLATACGRPLFYAEVEIPSAVVTVPQQAFPAIPVTDFCSGAGTDPSALCSQTLIEYDLGQDLRDLLGDATTVDLRLTQLGLALTATDPMQDLSAVRRVRVFAEGRDASTPTVLLASYLRDDAAPAARDITVGTSASVNLGGYLQAGFIALRADLEVDPGGLPAFTADVTGDFYLRVTLDWGRKAGIL